MFHVMLLAIAKTLATVEVGIACVAVCADAQAFVYQSMSMYSHVERRLSMCLQNLIYVVGIFTYTKILICYMPVTLIDAKPKPFIAGEARPHVHERGAQNRDLPTRGLDRVYKGCLPGFLK